MIFIWLGIVLIVVLDQLIKLWAIRVLEPVGSMDFITIGGTEILGFRYLENAGAAFGSFSGMRWVLVAVTALLCLGCILYLYMGHDKSPLLRVALTLVVGGGLGNMIDRIFRDGYVIDYIEVRLFDFAIFNFADCCVVIGVILLAIELLFAPGSPKPSEAQAEETVADEVAREMEAEAAAQVTADSAESLSAEANTRE